ncbi:hypothetical protein EJV47_22565 [Hymenobacter gummosus]|uniref:Outer membrane protein assembly factor BamE n=1 Tax=Hymenobacter gummosus TaxID=1776032 RepID=A0A3S0K267_9BACT|nr:hypothetical protein [Hymenobacter gummosus]RTQ46311.1 hypothetical protein EJV47_22565 [Hymenobacter gummosus]
MKKLALLVASIASVYLVAKYDVIRLDGISGEIWNLFLGENTQYAPDYSHSDFAKISIGMSQQQVEQIHGKPLVVWKPYEYTKYDSKKHFVGYEYSQSPTSTHYRLRQVYFDGNKVAEVISYFYVD